MEPILRTQGLTKDFGQGRGILDLDLEVQAGEVFGFLGPNGAGKTTTIRLLLDFLRPTRGGATIMGRDVRTEGTEVRRHIGYLPGELALYGVLTGRDLIQRVARLRGDVDPEWVEVLAKRFKAQLDRPVRQLSLGNKRKIGLIMAFMARPTLLLLDEPITGLDPLIQREVQALIREAAAAGVTVFLSSHNLTEVERTCDRIGIVRDGRLLVVERLDAIRARRPNRLVFTFQELPSHDIFTGLPGVKKVERRGKRVRVTIQGPVDAVVKAAAQYTLADVESQDPGLEELFLHYYTGAHK